MLKFQKKLPIVFAPTKKPDTGQNLGAPKIPLPLRAGEKNGSCVKKLSERATACPFHLLLQAFVAVFMKLNARAGIIFRNCEKSNDGNTGKGDKSVIQNNEKSNDGKHWKR